MSRGKSTVAVVVVAGLAGSSAIAGEVINFDLAPGQQATVGSGPTGISFEVVGRLEVDAVRDTNGQMINAGLVGANLTVLSAAVYDFGALGLVSLSNIGITLARPGGQEYFFNEASPTSPVADFAGFLDTGAIADLTGTIGVDTDRDGTADQVSDLADLAVEDRTFDFEALIMRERDSAEYNLFTSFSLGLVANFNGADIPIDIAFDGDAAGRLIPTPGGFSIAGLVAVLGLRRRRR